MADLNSYSKKWFVKNFGEGEEAFLVEFMPDSEFERLEKECSVINKKGKNDTIKSQLDVVLFNEKIIDRCLKDWKGMSKGKKDDVPCNSVNKKLMINNLPNRTFFVVEMARNPVAFNDNYEEIKKKLLESLSSSGNGQKETNQEPIAESV